jgi:uncharacterized protein YndB with AHSA1/START domain/ketosteroid isomerase-like protein
MNASRNRSDDATFHISLERRFAATPQRVFDEWLDPEALKDWFSPKGSVGVSGQADAVSGGAWQVIYRMPDGTEIAETGTYFAIDRPRRIEMTLSQDLEWGAKHSCIVVTISAEERGTLMRFTQTGLTSAAQRDTMAEGWGTCFDRLARRLATAGDVDAVRHVIRSWERAIQTGDIDGILANHPPDVLMFDVNEPIQFRGTAEYRKTWDFFFSFGAPADDLFVIEELAITAGPQVAFATGLLRIGGSEKPICRQTLGLTQIDGRWLIAHEHHSVADPVENEVDGR